MNQYGMTVRGFCVKPFMFRTWNFTLIIRHKLCSLFDCVVFMKYPNLVFDGIQPLLEDTHFWIDIWNTNESLDDFQVVLSPIQGGPAQRAGILTGDELVQIDGKHISAYRSEVENTINYLIRTSTSLPDYASLRLQMWHLQAWTMRKSPQDSGAVLVHQSLWKCAEL